MLFTIESIINFSDDGISLTLWLQL